MSVLFFCLKSVGLNSNAMIIRQGWARKNDWVSFFRSEGAKVRVSRAEQAQAIAHDTRREWGRSPSNLSFSARKKHTFVYQDNVCFFQRNLPLRASEIATLWNICFTNVKYSLTRMWANFISHCDQIVAKQWEQYFTIHEVNYFTFGVRRIFHLKYYRFFDIINSPINKNLWRI